MMLKKKKKKKKKKCQRRGEGPKDREKKENAKFDGRDLTLLRSAYKGAPCYLSIPPNRPLASQL